jgi:predicted SprT family Zn-dependent metalloprotease
MKPTDELYQSLQTAYTHFNEALFQNKLPDVIFTVQRQKGVLGYFAPERWSSLEGKKRHEIAINPSHIGQSTLIDVMQTLVHEMVHCWQHCFGTPSRNHYHNREWAHRMKQVGLQPTSTGLPGGATVGQQMSDYPIEGGAFLQSCYELIENESFNIPWIDRLPTPKSTIQQNSESTFQALQQVSAPKEQSINNATIECTTEQTSDTPFIADILQTTYSDLLPVNSILPPIPRKGDKKKYQCPRCLNRVWGKPRMNIVCGDCNTRFEWISD